MEEPDYDLEYLRDQAILEEERRMRMEAEYQDAEQLPAKIIVEIKIPENHENNN